MKRRLQESWDTFKELCIPPAVQLIEMRRAFYSGAEAFFRIQDSAYDGSTPEPTEDDVAVLSDLHDELTEFAQQISQGVV